MTRTELIIQLLKVAIGLAFVAYFGIAVDVDAGLRAPDVRGPADT
jgi:hypothetical protein